MSKIVLNGESIFVSDSNDIVDTLAELTDTAITSPANNQILRYDAGTGKWVNADNSELVTLNALSDVTVTTPADGDLLIYNSGTGEWENNNTIDGGTF